MLSRMGLVMLEAALTCSRLIWKAISSLIATQFQRDYLSFSWERLKMMSEMNLGSLSCRQRC